MKELKVRAWHKNLNEFVRLDKYTVLTADGIAPIDCELEFFSGRSDRKGVDIFQGDIVEYVGRPSKRAPKQKLTDEVVFKDGMFTVKNNRSDLYDFAILKIVTVIGNIHQNPELLEQKP